MSSIPHGLDALKVAPEHDPRAVEYAVVMTRYDESATLAARLGRRDVSPPDMGAIGAALAGMHEHAPVQHDGTARWLASVIDETLATLRDVGAPERRVEELRRFCRAALAAFGPELDERARLGRVRDGHGDLRAEHVLMGDPIQLVDAIEFDPELRIADVGYDLAFLVMDVTRTDDDLARALVRGYRAAGGDPGSERLLAFFCAVRALVRAKVDLLRAAQLDRRGRAGPDRARAGAARARRALRLAGTPAASGLRRRVRRQRQVDRRGGAGDRRPGGR